jgi:hypothetical protein
MFLGLTATAVVLTPITAEAVTFDYSRLENISARPIESNDILTLSGTPSQNQGYIAFSNQDPNAPDAGHVGIGGALSGGRVAYYATGRDNSFDGGGATTSTSLENITGFSNFFNYLNSNNILPSTIGVSFGQKDDRDITKTWSLGEDKLGQDWFVNADSTVGEAINRANPDDVEIYLSYGTTKIINFGYTDFYTVSAEDVNIILGDPIPAFKVAGLDPLASGLADAFLLDVATGGGSVQLVSEAELEASDVSFSNSNGFDVINISLPLEVRVVKSKSVPEASSVLGVLMFGILGTATRMAKQKKSSF